LKPTLSIQRLEVESLRGVRPRDAFALKGLSPAVNVVFGPNGIGKSTVAHAIQASLWPALANASARVRAGVQVGDDEASVALTHGSAKWSGLLDPNVGPKERSRYYRLSLEEMVRDDVGDVAERVRRLLAGGLDLQAAAAPWSAAFSDPVTETQALRRAGEELIRARRAEIDVHNASIELPERRRRLKELEGRLASRDILAQALDYRDRLREAREQRARHRAFDRRLRHMDGTEATALDGLLNLLGEQRKRIDEAEHQLARTTDDGTATPLATTLPAGALDELRRRAADLATLETSLSEAGRTVNTAREGLRVRLAALTGEFGGGVTASDLEPFRGLRYAELARELREVEAVRATVTALETLRHHLAVDEPDVETRSLDEAVNALQDWLASPTEATAAVRPSWITPAMAGGLVAKLVGLAISFSVGIAGAALAALGAALVAYAAGRIPPAASATGGAPREEASQRYLRTGLSAPSAWEADAVRRRLRELQDDQARANLVVRRKALWEAKEPEWQRELAQVRHCEANLADLRARGQFAGAADSASFARLLGQLDSLMDQVRVVEEGEAAYRHTLDALNAARQKFNAAIASFGYQAAEDARSAETAVARLEARAQATENLAAAYRRLEELEVSVFDVYRQSGAHDVEELRRLSGQHREFVKATDDRRRALEALRQARRTRRAIAWYRDWSPERLVAELDQLQAVAEDRDQLQREIAKIESRVDTAKQGRDLEEALAKCEAAVEVLAADRDAQIRSTVGRLLADFVDAESRAKEMPAVFRHAARLFGDITLGRYELRYERDEFRAVETRDGTLRPLNELSAGTRVQLLLAVRLGFLEEDETVRLPLLLDETLATSDVDRARAVIQAVGRLAAGGRQVFYFTAQPEDMTRWEAILGEEGVDVHTVDLGRVRGEAAAERLVAPVDLGVRIKPLPKPAGLDYHAYGKLLDVPPRIDPYAVGGTHLWHLMEGDTETLFRLLYLGRETWGQVVGDGSSLVPAAWPRLLARGKVAEIAASFWIQGRPVQRVDTSVLVAAGLTVAQADAMRAALDAENDDPLADGNRLYRRLEKKVTNEQVGTRRKVQEYLLTQGLADLRDALDADGVLRETLRRVVDDPVTADLPREDVERIVLSMEIAAPAPSSLF
jgi:DNA repair exonuclease SbcCD ATPase subunit